MILSMGNQSPGNPAFCSCQQTLLGAPAQEAPHLSPHRDLGEPPAPLTTPHPHNILSHSEDTQVHTSLSSNSVPSGGTNSLYGHSFTVPRNLGSRSLYPRFTDMKTEA